MKTKTKYILLILVILGIALLYYNHNNALTETSFDPVELKYSKWFFGIGILCVGLYFSNKNWRNVLTKIMLGTFGICFALNLYLFIQIYEYVQINKVYAEYAEIETCEEMQKQFETDLKKDELKYFHFGLGSIIGAKELLKSKYKIEYFSMGCIIESEMECYNKLVEKHIREKYKKSISDIFKETDFNKLIEAK
ncbi:hypothetical protein [Seonamhaeicola sp.]|uniref:FEKKY domain-containing protein n=1 Tax=Seonamhaeicola sp. TaxID=1912245 RepID=UPI00261018C1|nr:hypothetical protein [Seonamhaeicola sp.]